MQPVAHGSVSLCETYRGQIMAGLAQGLSGRRIYQDLVADHGFTGAYNTVKRYLARLNAADPLPFRRLEMLPGEEMQVDFGMGAWVQEPGSKKRRRPWVLGACGSMLAQHLPSAVLCFWFEYLPSIRRDPIHSQFFKPVFP